MGSTSSHPTVTTRGESWIKNRRRKGPAECTFLSELPPGPSLVSSLLHAGVPPEGLCTDQLVFPVCGCPYEIEVHEKLVVHKFEFRLAANILEVSCSPSYG